MRQGAATSSFHLGAGGRCLAEETVCFVLGCFFFFLQDQEMGFLVSELQGSRRRSDHVTFLHARALVKTGNELPGHWQLTDIRAPWFPLFLSKPNWLHCGQERLTLRDWPTYKGRWSVSSSSSLSLSRCL